MGIRGEIYSTKVSLQNRTYFFNVKENRLGDLYLNIVESKNKDTGGFDRQSVVLFADDLTEFLKGFDDSLKVLEKAAREKRKAPEGRNRTERPDRGSGEDRGGREREGFHKGGPRQEQGSFDRGRGEPFVPGKPRTGKPKVFKRSETGRGERKWDGAGHKGAPFKGEDPKGAPHKGGSFQSGPAKGPRKPRTVKAVRRDDGPRDNY